MASVFLLSLRNLSRSALKCRRAILKFEMSTIASLPMPHYRNQTCRCLLSEKLKRSSISYDSVRRFQRTSISSEEMKIINVPTLAESVTEGDIRWDKKKGDAVAMDEVVAHIETDKTNVPVPTPVSGVIEELFAQDGATVKPGEKLFKIKLMEVKKKKVEAPKVSPAPAKKAPQPPPTAPPPPSPKAKPPPPGSKTPPPSSKLPPPPSKTPAVPSKTPPPPKKAPTPASVPAAHVMHGTRTEQRVKINRLRARIAQRLKESQNTNAMLTTFNEINMSSLIAFRKKNMAAFQKKYNVKLGFMSAFVKASAYALQDQPVVNAVIDGNEVIYRDYIDISIAVATPRGLVVPVLRNVQTQNFADIEIQIKILAEKAIKGTLAVEDMDGGTFTITNGGVFGSLMSTPIINPPQSAILGMHTVVDRPVALKGRVVVRPVMIAALTYDHRLIDGREAVLFLRKVVSAIEDPRIMFLGL